MLHHLLTLCFWRRVLIVLTNFFTYVWLTLSVGSWLYNGYRIFLVVGRSCGGRRRPAAAAVRAQRYDKTRLFTELHGRYDALTLTPYAFHPRC